MMPKIMAAITATPPITPPAIAPTGVFLLVGWVGVADGAGGTVGEGVGVVVGLVEVELVEVEEDEEDDIDEEDKDGLAPLLVVGL
jgi:hypothetical protein